MADACCSCEGIKALLDEFLEEVRTLSKSSGKTKTKRAPSEYNLFIGSCLKGKTGKITERMRACAIEWKAKKK